MNLDADTRAAWADFERRNRRAVTEYARVKRNAARLKEVRCVGDCGLRTRRVGGLCLRCERGEP